jgi:prohibitin 1
LYRVDPRRATVVYKTIGPNYAAAVVRPSARSCIRTQFTLYPMVAAVTTNWRTIESDAAKCLRAKIEPRGLLLQDFQLREVTLSSQLQTAVNSKVASQQNAEQQKFELATAEQAADIARIQALATADSQQILACGGKAATVSRNGIRAQTVVPNSLTNCSQSQLTPQYLQFTYIQALKSIVTSPNTSTVILPFDQNLTPLLNVNPGSGTTPTTSRTPTTVARP